MAEVKATVSFAGAISMSQGEVREVSDKALLDDLLAAGYVVETAKKTPPKRGVKNDNSKHNK